MNALNFLQRLYMFIHLIKRFGKYGPVLFLWLNLYFYNSLYHVSRSWDNYILLHFEKKVIVYLRWRLCISTISYNPVVAFPTYRHWLLVKREIGFLDFSFNQNLVKIMHWHVFSGVYKKIIHDKCFEWNVHAKCLT